MFRRDHAAGTSRRLEHTNRKPTLPQLERGSESGDSCTDNDDIEDPVGGDSAGHVGCSGQRNRREAVWT